jgi:hypothetical protein
MAASAFSAFALIRGFTRTWTVAVAAARMSTMYHVRGVQVEAWGLSLLGLLFSIVRTARKGPSKPVGAF